MNDTDVALAWYSETEYSKFLDSSDDPEVWDQNYESWKLQAETLILLLATKGTEVVKVPLTLAEVEEWCARQGKQNVAESRSEIAAQRLRDDAGRGGK